MKGEIKSSKGSTCFEFPLISICTFFLFISKTLICSSNSLISSYVSMLLRCRAVALAVNWDCSVGDLFSVLNTHSVNSSSRKFNVLLMPPTFDFSYLVWTPSWLLIFSSSNFSLSFFIACFASPYFVWADLKATKNDVESRNNSEMLSFNVAFRKLNPHSIEAWPWLKTSINFRINDRSAWDWFKFGKREK